MPKRTDLKKILIIGAGPIVISQACEFDYSGAQACKALREEGYEVVLVNSNPATIMTDPEMADKTYIEPISTEFLSMIIKKERVDAILPTLGGQTALNAALDLYNEGVLKEYNVELIGASIESIQKAEDRELFRDAMEKIGLKIPKSDFAYNLSDVEKIAEEIGFPIIIRPSFTLGGTGGGIAYNKTELLKLSKAGLDASPISQVMLEQSVLGWKEYELEVVRDKKDNVVIVCSIENFDPMGIHTGDSITVAPVQTLSDKEYQRLRDASISIMREIGVDTGGSNVQFAVNPEDGDLIVVEMNPRVSRSSALASKATGYPIAKIAAKLAVGYTLDEIPNDITGKSFASFEPSIDYCVVKIPRWTFEKFPEAENILGTAMKSVGETMSIGRTFKESFQKALRSLEIGRFGFGADGKDSDHDIKEIEKMLATPNSERVFYLKEAIQKNISFERIYELCKIDFWFLHQLKEIIDTEEEIIKSDLNYDILKKAKRFGFSDRQIAFLKNTKEEEIAKIRKDFKIVPVYKLVDTCAAEYEAKTPYYYSSYEQECEARVSEDKKIVIIGGGPNRIGQGIEFDYCCVHASFALKEENIESIMINSNPETVSTDYDTSDKLYFEPLTKEDILHILENEKPDGVIVQFGGQTPLNLAKDIDEAGFKIIGTSPKNIDAAEDRKLFGAMLNKLNLKQPKNGTANSIEEAIKIAEKILYPVLVRPSYVLGGRAMKVVYDEDDLKNFVELAILASPKHPILIDKFLEDSIEVDVDALSDGKETVIGGIMEHIEEAGIHSGDSSCVLPPKSIKMSVLKEIKVATKKMAKELNVIGLMNVQYAICKDELYVLEVNPRASRTIPFVSKATGVPLAKIATKLMLGKTLKEAGFTKEIVPEYFSVKEAVLPFDRFENVDVLLGPEMKSTGEVMGIDFDFGAAFAKAQFGAKQKLKKEGSVFISVKDKDKDEVLFLAKEYQKMGFTIIATQGTSDFLSKNGVENTKIKKISIGRPNVVDAIQNGEIDLILNTPSDKRTKQDGYEIRQAALKYQIPYTTTIAGAKAVCKAIFSLKENKMDVKTIQDYYMSQYSKN